MKVVGWNQKTIEEFNAKQGRGVGPWGDNLLVLTARGCKSDEEIRTPLVFRREGDRYVVVASKGGAPDNPKWYHNVQVNPEVDIEVAGHDGTEHIKAKARAVPSGPERDRLYEYMTAVWPSFADYQKKTDRTIPIVLLEPIDK
jgi:deazaflavin-dependent oxidoreductase (nitroreductase family)